MEMNEFRYRGLLADVMNMVNRHDLARAKATGDHYVRCGLLQDVLRSALRASSLCVYNGTFYYFSGQRYEPVSGNIVANLIYDMLNEMDVNPADMLKSDVMIKTCQRVLYNKVLQQDNALMVLRNGVFDMDRFVLRPFDYRLAQTTKVDYDYDRSARPFMWKMFLDQVLPNSAHQKVLQEFLGACFIDRKKYKIENMLILYGNGSNGKSVIFETVMGVLGKETVGNYSIRALLSSTERKQNVASINGKRLNYCSEIGAYEIKSADQLKALISGEPMEARLLYGQNFTAYDIPLLMANANRLPHINDWSYGMRRRLTVIPFEVEIPVERQNKALASELRSEYSAIFNWMLEGRERLLRNNCKFTFSESLARALDDYQADSNPIIQFMKDQEYHSNCDKVVDMVPHWIGSTVLYGRYETWCKKHKQEPDNKVVFNRVLIELGYRRKRVGGGNKFAVYDGRLIETEKMRKDARERAHEELMEQERIIKQRKKDEEAEFEYDD